MLPRLETRGDIDFQVVFNGDTVDRSFEVDARETVVRTSKRQASPDALGVFYEAASGWRITTKITGLPLVTWISV